MYIYIYTYEAHCFHLIRDRVGPKIGLDVRSKRTPFNTSNEDCSLSDHRLLITNAFLWLRVIRCRIVEYYKYKSVL
jgi:hypothetical protein